MQNILNDSSRQNGVSIKAGLVSTQAPHPNALASSDYNYGGLPSQSLTFSKNQLKTGPKMLQLGMMNQSNYPTNPGSITNEARRDRTNMYSVTNKNTRNQVHHPKRRGDIQFKFNS